MEVSAEISLYPLTEKYKDLIYSFVENLKKQPGITVDANRMSTRIFGSYDSVTKAINDNLKPIFEQKEHIACIIKYMNSNRQ